MQIDVNEIGLIRLKEVYSEIEIVSSSGDSFIIAERDNHFEFRLGNKWYTFDGTRIKPMFDNQAFMTGNRVFNLNTE